VSVCVCECVRARVFLRGIHTRTQTETGGGKIGTEHAEGRSRQGGAEERCGGSRPDTSDAR
jgi:hypothetical protein